MFKVKKNADYVNYKDKHLLIHFDLKGKGIFYISGVKKLNYNNHLKKLNIFKIFFQILSVDCYIHIKPKRNLIGTFTIMLNVLNKLKRALSHKSSSKIRRNTEELDEVQEKHSKISKMSWFSLQDWWIKVVIFIGICSILVYLFIDISKTKNLMNTEIKEIKDKCQYDYKINNCEKLSNLPSLKEFCSQKLSCIMKEHEITYYSLLMKIVVDLLNQIVNTLDNKVLVMCSILIMLKVYRK